MQVGRLLTELLLKLLLDDWTPQELLSGKTQDMAGGRKTANFDSSEIKSSVCFNI